MKIHNSGRGSSTIIAAASLILAIMCLAGCPSAGAGGGGGDNGSGDDGGSARLTINGDLGNGAVGSVFSASAVDFAQVEQVMLFYGDSYVTVDVDETGKFTIPVNELETSGIVLVGPDRSFNGVLSFGASETSLPLHVAEETLTTIDLGLLNAGADEATTNFDVDEALDLSVDERAAFSAASDFFESVMRNPDIDGNNVLDPLEDLFIEGTFQINFDDWTIPAGDLSPDVASVAIKGHNPYIGITHPTEGSSIYDNPTTLTLPDNTVVNGTKAGEAFKFGNHLGLPQAGDYVFSLDALGITFDYSLSTDTAAGAFVYAVIPTIVLNGDGTVNKVTWDVVDTDMNPVASAPLMLDYIYIGFDVATEHAATYGLTVDGNQQQVYSTGNIDASMTEHTFENQGIQWGHIVMAYSSTTDLFGNRYEVMINVEH